jgi:hypothetical protein
MPGSVPNGSLNRIWVGLSQPPTTPVDFVQGWEYGGEAATQKEEFYMDDAAITTTGEPTNDGTVSGKYATGAAGLAILAAAFRTQDVIYFGVAPGGTDGEGLPGRVSRFRLTGAGRQQAAGYTFSIVQAEEPADIAGGLF